MNGKRRIRFLFFGKKAWDARFAIAGSFMQDCEEAGHRVQVRRVLTERDVRNLRIALRRPGGTEWSHLCYGNIDIKVAEPLGDLLWGMPKGAPKRDILDFSMPTHFNAWMGRVRNVRRRRPRAIKED